MSEWKECKIADAPFEIIDGDRGVNYPKQNEFSQNGYCLFLNAKNVTVDGFAFDECYFISKEKDQILRKGKLQRNDIVLTTRGTVGNIGFFNNRIPYENIRLNSGMVIIRPNPRCVSPEYTHQLFKYLKNDFDTFATGSAQPQLPIRDLKEILVLLPSLPEQRAIAGVLSSLDDKIDLLHRQNKTLEGMAEAVYRHFFIDNRKVTWEECSVAELANHQKVSIHPNRNPTALFYHYSIPAFDEACMPIREFGTLIQSNKYEVTKNTILFSKLNPHKDKRIWLIPSLIAEHSVCSTEFQVMSPKAEQYLFFLYGFISHPENYNEIAAGVGGTSGSHQRIDPEMIFTFKCFLPDDSTLTKYNEIVEPIFAKIHHNRQSIQTLIHQRDLLLPKLMSGEVRVKP